MAKKLQIEKGEKNEILREISTPVVTNEFRNYKKIVEDMLKHIKNPENGGVGLAAPQIGVNKRIIVASLMKDYDDENYRIIPMINPVILAHSDETTCDQEGCLSLPGENGDVVRYAEIDIEFYNIEGRKFALHLKDLAARIVQHEIDHLNGILFTDHIGKETPEL